MRAFSILLIAAVSVACAKTDAAADPVWGKQACAHCSMLMSDRRFGAQLVTTEGDRLFFDDVGCMIVFESKNRPAVAREWVKNASGADWVEATTAKFEPASASPMGFGFEASASGSSSWPQIRANVLAHEEALR